MRVRIGVGKTVTWSIILLLTCGACTEAPPDLREEATPVVDEGGQIVGVMHADEFADAMEAGATEVPVYDTGTGVEIGVFRLGGEGGYTPHRD